MDPVWATAQLAVLRALLVMVAAAAAHWPAVDGLVMRCRVMVLGLAPWPVTKRRMVLAEVRKPTQRPDCGPVLLLRATVETRLLSWTESEGWAPVAAIAVVIAPGKVRAMMSSCFFACVRALGPLPAERLVAPARREPGALDLLVADLLQALDELHFQEIAKGAPGVDRLGVVDPIAELAIGEDEVVVDVGQVDVDRRDLGAAVERVPMPLGDRGSGRGELVLEGVADGDDALVVRRCLGRRDLETPVVGATGAVHGRHGRAQRCIGELVEVGGLGRRRRYRGT